MPVQLMNQSIGRYQFVSALPELVSVALAQNLKERLHQDLNVKPKRPVVDVPKVHFDPSGDQVNGRGSTSQTIYLGPARHARFDVMPEGVRSRVAAARRCWQNVAICQSP